MDGFDYTDRKERALDGVESVRYDFTESTGEIYLEDEAMCDKGRSIKLFTSIDPEVKNIDIYSGMEKDCSYIRESEGWAVKRYS